MKISVAFALLVGSASASKSAKVGVTCKNLDVNALTPKALAYAAKAVEMTFNDVHSKETAHAVAVGSFAGDSNLRTKVSSARRAGMRLVWFQTRLYTHIILFSLL